MKRLLSPQTLVLLKPERVSLSLDGNRTMIRWVIDD